MSLWWAPTAAQRCSCGARCTLRLIERQLRDNVRVAFLAYCCRSCGQQGRLSITEPEAAEFAP